MSWWTLYILFEWCIRIVMIPVIIRRRFPPPTALAWLAVVFVLPELGLVGYLLFGDVRLGKRRVRLHRAVIQASRTKGWREQQKPYVVSPRVDPSHEPLILQAERISGMPIVGGNHIELLVRQRETIDRLIADIEGAKHHVHLMYYIFRDDATGQRVVEALLAAAQRGVTCRVLADAVGSRSLFRRNGLAGKLRQGGVQISPMLPAAPLRRRLARLDIRNHRKLAVIDGHIAHSGSQNIVDPDYGNARGRHAALAWVDLSARLTGPIVAQLQTVFLEDWAFETEEVLGGEEYLPHQSATGRTVAQAVPTGPSHEAEYFPRVLLTAIHAARREVVITTPYLILDEPMMLALAMAADRGVHVRVVVPEASDHRFVSFAGRSYFTRLLRAGVRVYRYHPGLLHAKTMTVDDSFSLLGSSNMDIRSFYLNFEINVLLLGAEITKRLREVQQSYIEKSTELRLGEWIRRPRLTRLVEDAAALLSPLL